MVMAYVVLAYIVMVCIGMAYIVTAYIVMACTVMVYVVMADIVVAYVVMAYVVTAGRCRITAYKYPSSFLRHPRPWLIDEL